MRLSCRARSRSTTRRCATAPRAKASPSRWRTRSGSPSGSTPSACTTSRAAGRGPTPRTSTSSGASQDAVFKHGPDRAPSARRGGRGVRPQEDPNLQALVEAGHARRHDLRQDVGLPRHRRAAHHARREPGDDRRLGGYLLKHWSRRSSTTPNISSTASSANPDYALRDARTRRRRRAPTVSCSATPTAARLPARDRRAPSARCKAREAGHAARHPHAQRRRVWRWPTRSRPSRPGADHVQGTINGYGERSGNANLISVIANVMLKLGLDCIPSREPARAARRLALRRRNSRTANRGRRSPTWGIRPSPTRGESTSPRCSSTPRPTSMRTPRSSAITGGCSSPSWRGSPMSSGRRASTGSTSTRTRPTPGAFSRCSSGSRTRASSSRARRHPSSS